MTPSDLPPTLLRSTGSTLEREPNRRDDTVCRYRDHCSRSRHPGNDRVYRPASPAASQHRSDPTEDPPIYAQLGVGHVRHCQD